MPIGPKVARAPSGEFYNFFSKDLSKTPSNSLENSEFGARYSSLLPIGNGLQASFIYLYEFRSSLGQNLHHLPRERHRDTGIGYAIAPGTFLLPGFFLNRRHRGVPVGGTVESVSYAGLSAQSFLRLDRNLLRQRSDRHRVSLRHSVSAENWGCRSGQVDPTGGEWTEFTRWIIAADRPTYIPWISKQHTFITAQFTETWYPDRPIDATPQVTTAGKVRELSSLAFLNFTNWLMNGQLTAGNADPVGHRQQRRRTRDHQRLPIFAKRAVRGERAVVHRTQRPLHRSVPAQPPAAFQRTRVHVHVRNLEVDWTDRAAVAYAAAAFVFWQYGGHCRSPPSMRLFRLCHCAGRCVPRWTTTHRHIGTWFAPRPVRSDGSAISSPRLCRKCFCRCSRQRRRDGGGWRCQSLRCSRVTYSPGSIFRASIST